MRTLHTADWHLGRIFCGVHLTGDQEYLLENLFDIIKDGSLDAVVIGGDVFDRAVPPVDAVNLLDDFLGRVIFELRKPVIMIAGNHDSPDRLAFGRSFYKLQGLHVFGPAGNSEPVILSDQYGEVAFCPIPYADPPFVRDALRDEAITNHEMSMAALIRHALEASAGFSRRVAVAHAFVTGGQASDSERPLSIGGAESVPAALFVEFSYAALGHLHRPQKIGDRIFYPGSLMKYSFDEAGQNKAATIVEMDGEGRVSMETVELKPRRDVRIIRGKLEDLVRNADVSGREDYVKAVLTDEGALYDAMGQLKKAYPNALEIERQYLTDPGRVKGVSGDFRKFTDFDLFCDFYRQVTGRPISEGSLPELREALDELRRNGEAEA